MPSGLRVNCTAEASARNSRCRETAALIMLPISEPIAPRMMIARPTSSRYRPASRFDDERLPRPVA